MVHGGTLQREWLGAASRTIAGQFHGDLPSAVPSDVRTPFKSGSVELVLDPGWRRCVPILGLAWTVSFEGARSEGNRRECWGVWEGQRSSPGSASECVSDRIATRSLVASVGLSQQVHAHQGERDNAEQAPRLGATSERGP